MIIYELLEINRKLLEVFALMDINMSDLKYLDMYQDYQLLQQEGNKKTYTESFLCDKYDISKATFYRIISKFSRVVNRKEIL